VAAKADGVGFQILTTTVILTNSENLSIKQNEQKERHPQGEPLQEAE